MKKSKILVFVTILFLIGVGSFSIPRSAQAAGKTGYIYTGDSRTRRLNVTIGMSKMSRNWVHCKSGMGYSWFVNDSLPKINQTMEDHPEIDNWVIVSAWGEIGRAHV